MSAGDRTSAQYRKTYRILCCMPNYCGLRLLSPSAVSGSMLPVYIEVIWSLGGLPIRPPVNGTYLIWLINRRRRIIKPSILSVMLEVSYSIPLHRRCLVNIKYFPSSKLHFKFQIFDIYFISSTFYWIQHKHIFFQVSRLKIILYPICSF